MNVSLTGVLVALLFLVPGYLFATARRTMAIQPKTGELEFLIQSIIWSSVLYALAAVCGMWKAPTLMANVLDGLDVLLNRGITKLAGTSAVLLDIIIFFVCVWVLSWFAGLGFGFLDRRGLSWWIPKRLGKTRINRYVTEFDALFDSDPEWVMLILKDETCVQGKYRSVSVSPMPPEIQLEYPIYFGQAKETEFTLMESWDSFYIKGDDVRAIVAMTGSQGNPKEMAAQKTAPPDSESLAGLGNQKETVAQKT